jgi:hypothetical protein
MNRGPCLVYEKELRTSEKHDLFESKLRAGELNRTEGRFSRTNNSKHKQCVTLFYFRRLSSKHKSSNANNIQTRESLCVMSQHSISRAAECECSLVIQRPSLSYLPPYKLRRSASSLFGRPCESLK